MKELARRVPRDLQETSLQRKGTLEVEVGPFKSKTEGTLLPYVTLFCLTLIALSLIYAKYWHHGLMRKIKGRKKR